MTLERKPVDETVNVTAVTCTGCNRDLKHAPSGNQVTRQTIDIVTTTSVTDYVGCVKTCECGTINTPVFPPYANAPVCYGPGVKSLAVGLGCVGLLPSRVVSRVLSGFFDIDVAASSTASWSKQLGESLDQWDAHVRNLVRQSPVVNVDETPYKVEGLKNAHLHVACTPTLTVFHIAGRTKADIAAGNIVEGFNGVLVSDCLPSYWNMEVNANQALIAHLVREVTKFVEVYTPNSVTVPYPYPDLVSLQVLIQGSVKAKPPDRQMLVDQTLLLVGNLLETMLNENDSTARSFKALLRRIKRLTLDGDLYRFVDSVLVPPTNNAAEQAIRFAKIKQNRSKTHRSVPHSRTTVRVASYLDTARKNGVDSLKALLDALKGQPYTPPK